MPAILPSPYQLKKALMWPRKLYMRHRENLEPGFLRSAMELHYYRPAFYRWLGAVSANPDLLYEADLDSGGTVLDVGAYNGDWAAQMADRYHPRIIAFEPDPRNYRQLVARTVEGTEALSFGLGAKNETVEMSLQFLGSTVFDVPTGGQGDRADVEIRDVKEVWNELQLDQVDLMKINIEGGEFPLLERMQEAGLLCRVNCFLIQFHEWHPGAYRRRRRLQRALNESHELVWDHPFIWEKWIMRDSYSPSNQSGIAQFS